MTVGELKVLLEGISDDTLLLTYDVDEGAWYSPCNVGCQVARLTRVASDGPRYTTLYDRENEYIPDDKMITAFLI